MTTEKAISLTFTLAEPVTHNKVEYSQLTFRRMKGRDMLKMDLMKGELGKTMAMLASMSDTPFPVFEEMDSEDLQRLMVEVAPLMGNSAKKAVAKALRKADEDQSPPSH